jgi:hypothetical protein
MTDSLITGQKRREVAIGPEVSAAPGPPADLLSIGPDSVVLMDAYFNGYRARSARPDAHINTDLRTRQAERLQFIAGVDISATAALEQAAKLFIA